MSKLRLAIVAGELSGDVLGAGLLKAVAAHGIEVEAFGIGGPQMQAAGFDSWWNSSDISVMGLTEVLKHLPRLLRLKKKLREKIQHHQPHAFIGIDLPDFNLRLAKELRTPDCATVQYVSPSVWAWRPKRVVKIAAAVDLVLCLLPFEPAFYQQHQVRAQFVGHPSADRISFAPDTAAARKNLNLPIAAPTIALLPGSRVSEVNALGGIFLQAARLIAQKIAGVTFVTALASRETRAAWLQHIQRETSAPAVEVRDGPAEEVLAASDVALLASGTVALEALLVGRPMVVSYRLSGLSKWIVKGFNLINVEYFSLPNLLADAPLVPELMQENATPEKIAEAVITEYQKRQNQHQRALLDSEFAQIRQQLSHNADTGSAAALMALLDERQLFKKPDEPIR